MKFFSWLLLGLIGVKKKFGIWEKLLSAIKKSPIFYILLNGTVPSERFLLTHSTHNIKTLNRSLNHENNTYFERISHTRIVFDMPFEKRFMRSKMWDPVGTRFLILRNKPSYFNFAFAWRKKNEKSSIRNQKSEVRIILIKIKTTNHLNFNFSLPVKTSKSEIGNQILDFRI